MKSLMQDKSAHSTRAWRTPSRTDGAISGMNHSDGEQIVRTILQEQQASRLRSACFGNIKLRNPSWDMLVALFAAKHSGAQLSMSDLCLMCDAPESTALRLIHQLREKGYAEMIPDRSDRRRTRVSLTSLGEAQFHDYVAKSTPV